jgi:hypothetical protein
MSPKTKFNLMLEADQLAALRKIQEETGTPIAEQIRRAITDWIENPLKDPMLEEFKTIAAMPEPKEPAKRKIWLDVRQATRNLEKAVWTKRRVEKASRVEK